MSLLLRVVQWGGCALLALIAGLTFIDVILRYGFAKVLPGGYDLMQHLQAIAIFWGLAVACWHRSHITVDLLWTRMSAEGRGIIDRTSDFITSLAMAALFLCAALQLPKMLRSSEVIPDLAVPIWPFAAFAILGALVAGIVGLLPRPLNASLLVDEGQL